MARLAKGKRILVGKSHFDNRLRKDRLRGQLRFEMESRILKRVEH